MIGPVLGPATLDPIDLGDFLAGVARIDRQVLRPLEDEASSAVERLFTARRVGRRSQTDLRFSVAIEIADDHRRKPDAVIHVPPKVDAPQEGPGLPVVAINLVALFARHLTSWIDGARWMLDDEVVGAVGIEIADTHAIHASHVVAKRDGLVSGERSARPDVPGRGGELAPVHHRRDAPSAIRKLRLDRGPEIGRRYDRLWRQPRLAGLGGTVDVEPYVAWIGVEQAPAQIDSTSLSHHRDHTPIEPLADALGRPSERRAGFVQRVHRVEVQVRRDLFRGQRSQHLIVVLGRTRRGVGRRLWRRRLLLSPSGEDPDGQTGRAPHRDSADAHARLLDERGWTRANLI